MSLEIEIRATDGPLYSGPAELLEASSADHDWRIEFSVPANEVAQFQMRRGERVQVRTGNPRSTPSAIIFDFQLDASAGFSGFSGTGVIQLVGSGPAPAH